MKILVLSDLHLERFDLDTCLPDGRRIDAEADVVVLAGDIDSRAKGIHWASETFGKKPVVFVAGNHEFYGHTHEETIACMRYEAQECGVHFLERDAVKINGYRFLGATLWTDFKVFGDEKIAECNAESIARINDFRAISTWRPHKLYSPDIGPSRRFFPSDAIAIHEETIAWLEAELSRGDPAKTIVVSHHAPHRNSVLPKYAADLTTGAFASDLTRLMGRARLWIHGHMHNASDYEVNGTRVVTNPRGYVLTDDSNENPQFKPDLVIEV